MDQNNYADLTTILFSNTVTSNTGIAPSNDYPNNTNISLNSNIQRVIPKVSIDLHAMMGCHRTLLDDIKNSSPPRSVRKEGGR